MWNKRYSEILSLVCNRLMMGLLACCLLCGPALCRWDVAMGDKSPSLYPILLGALYPCVLLGLALLFWLDRLLRNIHRGEVFTSENTACMRRISWCCFAVALLCLGFTVPYQPFIFVAVAAGFVGLILRVMKNVFAQAVAIKEENDFTI